MPIPLQARQGEFPLTSQIPGVVLDTNVALDWLLFGDPSVAPLAAAISEGRLCWLATFAMREELAHVLERGLASRKGVDAVALLATFDRHVTIAPVATPVHTLLCTDADDQKFIDLAVASSARWLVSRDRAVLKLRRRAAGDGLAIVSPGRWRLE